MMNVNELKRNAKNIVKKYSDAQVKVREATSNDPWGPSSTLMAEIANLTFNVVALSEIMHMIWKRLNDHGKNWRHVFKSLVLLEYLIKTGNEKVAQQCMENIFSIQTLKDFQYIEDNKDHGMSVRDKSKKLEALLKDPERLKAERARAIKAKSRAVEAVSSSGKSSFGSMTSRSSNESGDIINSGSNGNNVNSTGRATLRNNDEGTSALETNTVSTVEPQSATEEETQLRIALALSLEEAERMEKTRKNDELRLKLALDVSKQTVSGTSDDFNDDFADSSSSGLSKQLKQSQTHQQKTTATKTSRQSNIDDLLGLSFTPPTNTVSTTSATLVGPTSMITNSIQGPSPFVAIPSQLDPQNDPWSTDPWQPMSSQALLQPATTSSFNQVAGFNEPSPLLTTLPTSTTPVTNAFLPNSTNVFGTNPAKSLSKNPFED